MSPATVYGPIARGELPHVLAELPQRFCPLFATATYAGLRKGELRALRKSDVDLERRLILVRRSGERTTTIGGHADAVPIHSERASSCRRPVGNAPRGGEVHIYCYWLLNSLGQVHA